METQFKAPWDRLNKVSTTFFCLLILGVAIASLMGGSGMVGTHTQAGAWVPFAVSAALILMLVLVAVYGPRGYSVSRSEIKILRPIGSITVPLMQIKSIHTATFNDIFRGAIRTWASGGAFGYWGRFWSKKMHSFDVYATDLKKLVFIERKNAVPLVISPDDPEEFVEAVQQLIIG